MKCGPAGEEFFPGRDFVIREIDFVSDLRVQILGGPGIEQDVGFPELGRSARQVERAERADVQCGDREVGQFPRADLRGVGEVREDGHGGRVEVGSECLNGLCGVCFEDELRAFDSEVIGPAADDQAEVVRGCDLGKCGLKG